MAGGANDGTVRAMNLSESVVPAGSALAAAHWPADASASLLPTTIGSILVSGHAKIPVDGHDGSRLTDS